jgi:phosphomevalonate kinase
MAELTETPPQLLITVERANELIREIMDDYLLQDSTTCNRLVQVMTESVEEFKRHRDALRLIQERGLADIESIFEVSILRERIVTSRKRWYNF